MSQTHSTAQILAAADLADNFIAEILDAEPKLLIGKVADEDSKDIAKAARKLAEFRLHLIDALAEQPLGNADRYEAEEDEEIDDELDADDETDAEADDAAQAESEVEEAKAA